MEPLDVIEPSWQDTVPYTVRMSGTPEKALAIIDWLDEQGWTTTVPRRASPQITGFEGFAKGASIGAPTEETMRIIGGHDYYDSALAYGHDPSVVLVREKDKLIERKEAERIGLVFPRFDLPYRGRLQPYGQTAVVVGDKLHMGISYSDYPRPTTYAWSREALEKMMTQNGDDFAPSRWGRRRWRWDDRLDYRQEAERERYFEPVLLSLQTRDYLVKNRVSILVLDRDGWLINPDCLKEIDFAKRIDPYTLFQELDMWVSGVLGMPANPMVEVSNDVKVHKHGFDKFSFRKPKSA